MSGYKVVLTADRTLMSEYHRHIFLGFSACVPQGLISDRLYFSMFCPSVETNGDGSVVVAPNGTRKIEAALLDYGFRREDVIVAHPDRLGEVVGPETKVIGITENDPLGIGPATSTFTGIFGGEAYMALKFREVLNHPSVKKFGPKIIVGGPGAWQLEDEQTRARLGIDCVVVGEGEKSAGALFESAVNGGRLPGVVRGELVPTEEIPVIRGATVNGIVEIARGCGRGCDFCEPTLLWYRSLPIEHILKEVDVNLQAGRQPVLHAEDVLRYKAKGLEINKEATVELFKAVRDHPGVSSVGISHFALSSVASAPDLIGEISRVLDVSENTPMGGQTGIETGSSKLIKEHMAGKCKPFKPEDWPETVVDAFEILSENHWIPCATLIMGLPSETEKDVDLTIELVERLGEFKSLIVPLFFVSMGGLRGKAESFTMEKMTPKHSELLLKCWEHNFNWLPSLIKEADPILDSRLTKFGLRIIASYAANTCRKLFRRCREEYGYDLSAMISDIKNGEINVTPMPIRFASRLLKI
ncbi:MAG: radical SAM protein [Candidatus Hodarchaeaceae archaeon]|nr:radical SAM protein [Candidatus Hodarchaeaceae archaeon]